MAHRRYVADQFASYKQNYVVKESLLTSGFSCLYQQPDDDEEEEKQDD